MFVLLRAAGALALAAMPACGRAESPSRRDDAPPAPASAAGTDPSSTAAAEAAQAVHRRTVLDELTRWEAVQRGETDFARLPPWSAIAGPDPFRIRRLADGGALGLLRGPGAVVRVGPDGRPSGTPVTVGPDATGWASTADDALLYVVGPRSGRVSRLGLPAAAGQPVVPQGSFGVADTESLRDVAVSERGHLALADPFGHRVVVVVPPDAGERLDSAADPVVPTFAAPCGGPLLVRWTAAHLLAVCTLDHALLAWPLDPDGMPSAGPPVRVEHDGPMWSLDAQMLPDGATLRVALGGVEDHALDRSDGAFGNIDSFVFVTDIVGDVPRRRTALNVSALGAVTPKWIRLSLHDGGRTTRVDTVGYGSEALVTARWNAAFEAPTVSTLALVPGTTDLLMAPDGSLLAANPLLDAWVAVRGGVVSVHASPAAPGQEGHQEDLRDPEVRLGEALLFTGLMAPAATSEGKASRFTCETCHWEGGVDGRVHWTGRGEVHAATRPLRGLFNNRPHFSRALDTTMARMVDNEFRVASKGTGADPWFTLEPDAVPWVAHLGISAPVDAAGLRRAVMAFIMVFTHEPNPASDPDPDPDPQWQVGADLFARHCEHCHQARLVTDVPDSRILPGAWDALVRSDAGPIVWATEARMRTGIEPYVHETGARVPSLRRIHAKRPYFTDGGAPTLEAAVQRFAPDTAQHVHGDGAPPFSAAQLRALVRFLELL